MPIDRLSAEDVRILHLEAGNIRGHTCKLIVLEPGPGGPPLPSIGELRAHIEARLGAAPRLRRRLAPTPLRAGAPVWVDDPGFDIARHVRRVAEPTPVSPARLREIVAGLMTERLDRAHPLWRLDVVEAMSDGSMALIWRIHHCMADGGTAVRLGGTVLWSESAGEPARRSSPWRPAASPGPLSLLALGAASRLRGVAHVPVVLRPSRRRSLREARMVLRRELRRTASPTPLDCLVGPRRRVAFASAPLEPCRQAGKAIDPGVTVNDVVLAIVAGGMRVWLEHRHRPEDGIRVKVPVSLHDPGARVDTAANRDSYFFVELPVDEPGTADRVLAVSRETAARKRDRDADVLYVAARRPAVSRWAMSPRVFTLNASNVAGPRGDVYVLGAHVRELYSVAEIGEHHALRVSVISAAGTLFFGLCADGDAVEDVELIADGMAESARELVALAGAV